MNKNKSLHNYLLVIALGSALTMIGCSSETTTTPPPTSPAASPANTASPVASSPVTTAQVATGQYAGLAKVVADTTTAVSAGDFAKAKTEFDKFEGEWEKVEDALKAKSPTSYEAIENSVDKVETALGETQPAKDQVLASLQTLSQTIGTLGK